MSTNYSEDGSLGDVVGLSGAASAGTVKHGFMGQLYEAQSLAVTANPSSVIESLTNQLTGVATMDDGSLINLSFSDPLWSVIDGPLAGISANGLATAGEVFINAPATVRGSWWGIHGDLTLTVLNNNVAPPGTTVPDPVFTPQSFATNRIGLYQGILKDSNGNVVGAITTFNLLTTRAFTSKVVFNGITYSLAGTTLADGSFSGSILRTGKTPLAVTLQLGSTGLGGLTLRGTVTGDGTTGNGFIAQAPYTTLNKAPVELVKSYTFLVPAVSTGNNALPEGDGYGSAKVSTLGVITASGKTGDGVAFTNTSYLTADKQWHLFQLLYSSKGQIGGVLTFRDVPSVSDLDGGLRWVKNPNALDKSYSAGFNQAPSLVGSLYTPPLTGQRALTQLANQYYNARLSLAGTVLPGGGLAKTLSWLSTNALAYYGPETLSAVATASTGILSGSYYDPAIKLTVPFAGAVLQKQGLAGGNFLVSYKSGFLLIEPSTTFPYPGSEGAGALARLTLPGTPATPPTLTAVNFSTTAAGSFGGILNNGPNISGGLESIVVTTIGALTGTVVIEGKRYAFTGKLGTDGLATVVITRTGLPNIVGNIHLALASGTVDGFQLTGTFTADGIAHAIDAQRFPVFTTTAQAPQKGVYTLAMRSSDNTNIALEPGGDGYAGLTIAYTGTATGTLTLADGTVTTFANRVSRNGEWSLHRSLYGTTRGYLAGKLTFRNVTSVSDVDGQWRWVKPNAVPKTISYTAGFNVTRGVIGSLYTPPVVNTRALAGLSNTFYNTWLRLSGPDMSTQAALTLTSVDRAVTWNTANKILYYGPDKATFTFTTTTGLATGSYIDTAKGVSITFGGALLQKQGLLTGRYLASGQSGLFSIAKR
ncbi:MAG: hypothetical protein ACOYOF_16870 [Verrucomicrobiaceae bacterium]